MTATLAMRPVGASCSDCSLTATDAANLSWRMWFSFPWLNCCADLLPATPVFLILRTIYGIGMGGEWGVGASLAMESAPAMARHSFRHVQSGYSIGYLLAAVAAHLFCPPGAGAPCSGSAARRVARALHPLPGAESKAWEQHRAPTVGSHLKYCQRPLEDFPLPGPCMTLMMFLSHGTQDFIPIS